MRNKDEKKCCHPLKEVTTAFSTHPLLGIDAGGTAAIFKVTVYLEGIHWASTIRINPIES